MRISDWSSDVCSSDLFRDIAQSLSGSRDAKVLLDTCDLLIEGAPNGTDTDLLLPLRRRLANDLAKQAHGEGAAAHLKRSEERRVGKECVSTCISRGSRYTKKKKINKKKTTKSR